MACWGVIGGSGLDVWDELTWIDEVAISTPYGEPSSVLRIGEIERLSKPPIKVIYLPRHGLDHRYAPHRINYRANVWALKQAGVHKLIATATVVLMHVPRDPGLRRLPKLRALQRTAARSWE